MIRMIGMSWLPPIRVVSLAPVKIELVHHIESDTNYYRTHVFSAITTQRSNRQFGMVPLIFICYCNMLPITEAQGMLLLKADQVIGQRSSLTLSQRVLNPFVR